MVNVPTREFVSVHMRLCVRMCVMWCGVLHTCMSVRLGVLIIDVHCLTYNHDDEHCFGFLAVPGRDTRLSYLDTLLALRNATCLLCSPLQSASMSSSRQLCPYPTSSPASHLTSSIQPRVSPRVSEPHPTSNLSCCRDDTHLTLHFRTCR